MSNHWNAVAAKLAEAGSPEILVKQFRRHYENLCQGSDNFLREAAIRPASDVPSAQELDAGLKAVGQQRLDATVVLKLNGGLGTSMGLDGPKSLLPIRGQQSFLDLIVQQAAHLSVPVLLMNSFSTDGATMKAIHATPNGRKWVQTFLQHQVPKIDADTLLPVTWAENPELQWCPPGHGDIYAALVTSGTLEKLLADGKEFLFVSNSDNLGATLDLSLLGYFADSGAPFLMEVADRTLADRKGGHLACQLDGGLLLREKAQCHPADTEQFQDIETHRYFNTNNLWINLKSLDNYLNNSEGTLDLPTIINRKTVDPKDQTSTTVFQLETAMGAAIEVLPGSKAIRVPRSRFAPVKTTGDFLAVGSDAYEVRPDSSVGLIPERSGNPPKVNLDDHFRTIDELQKCFPQPPSLRECETLDVQGNLSFDAGVIIQGSATLIGTAEASKVPAGTYSGEHHFGR